MAFSKITISPVEPFSSFHLLEGVRVGIGVMLNNRLDLPQLRPFDVRFETQKDIDLCLPVLVLKVVVKVALDGGEKLKPAFAGLLNLLLMSETASVLD